jgi:membrane fusion protein (multidrug efflux system)
MSEPKVKKRKAGKNNLRITLINLAIFLVVAFLVIWALKSYLHFGDESYTNDAQVEAYINPVNTRVSAYIKEIRFIEHQHVKKGDTLVILDNREILTQLGQAEAAYLNATAGLQVASSSVNTVSNNVAVMESNIAEAKARLWNAEQQYKRYASLLKDEAVTRQQYEQVKTEYEAQKAKYESLISQKQSSTLSVQEAKSKTGVNKAEIKRAKEALEMAKLNLSYTVITAPNDGVIGRRAINEGQLLQAGQQVATLITDDNKWVTANFREKQMKEIQVGEKVNVAVDALGGKEFEGVITAISEATGSKLSAIPVDNSTGNFVKVQQRIPVRIEFTKANKPENVKLLRAGMNVEIKLK